MRLSGGQGTYRDHAQEYEDLTTATSPEIMPESTRIVPPPHAPNMILPPHLNGDDDDNDEHGIQIRETHC